MEQLTLLRSTDRMPFRLSLRESQLSSLLVQGLPNKEIAFQMGTTEGTIKVYASHLYHKVGVRSRFELAMLRLNAIQKMNEETELEELSLP